MTDKAHGMQGRIKPYMYGGMPVGPKRVWLPNAESPGLSMTRAFGDKVGASVGVTSQPEVRQVSNYPWVGGWQRLLLGILHMPLLKGMVIDL